MRAVLENLIARFNDRSEADESLRAELEGMEKVIQVITDRQRFHMILKNCRIVDLGEGELESADLTITADEETLRGVIEGSIPPFKAFATGKLKVKASLEDILRFRKLLL